MRTNTIFIVYDVNEGKLRWTVNDPIEAWKLCANYFFDDNSRAQCFVILPNNTIEIITDIKLDIFLEINSRNF